MIASINAMRFTHSIIEYRIVYQNLNYKTGILK